MARVQLLEEFVDKVGKTDTAAKAELRETRTERDAYANTYNGDCSSVTGDAKIFKEQVDDLRSGELASLFRNMNEHDQAFNERSALYSDYISQNTTLSMNNFRIDLLKHLAGSIVVKEHRLRY